MSVSVTMPQLGESVSEGTVTRWLKKEGDKVEADEPLLEVSTDKVDTEIPSPAAGVLTSIKVAEDETVEVGVESGLTAWALLEIKLQAGEERALDNVVQSLFGATNIGSVVVAAEQVPEQRPANCPNSKKKNKQKNKKNSLQTNRHGAPHCADIDWTVITQT